MRTIEHWIGGKPTSGNPAGTAPVWDPATGAQQAEVVLGSAGDVAEAVRVAAAAFEEWSQSSLSRRAKVLFAFRELATARAGELAELVSSEHGKVLSDARGEVDRGLEVVEFACGIPHLLKGSFSLGFSTTALPVAIAIGKNHMGTIAGKLNGLMMPTTPSGSLTE